MVSFLPIANTCGYGLHFYTLHYHNTSH